MGYAKELMHGKSSLVKVDAQSPLFKGLPAKVRVARYHSLSAPTFGVQFHPESILTPDGRAMIENFLAIATK